MCAMRSGLSLITLHPSLIVDADKLVSGGDDCIVALMHRHYGKLNTLSVVSTTGDTRIRYSGTLYR